MASLGPQQRQAPQPTSSQTQTTTTQTQTQTQTQAILRLRGAHQSNGRSVQWREDVVDNEGLGRKKSKVCCIYYRPKAVDESSDDSSSSDSSSSDSDSDDGSRKGNLDDNGKGKKPAKDGDDHQDCGHNHGRGRRKRGDGDGDGKRNKRKPSPNAYEKMPKYGPKDGSGSGSGKPQGPGGSKG